MKLINPVGTITQPQLVNDVNEATYFTVNGNFTPKATADYIVEQTGGGGGGAGGSAMVSTEAGTGFAGPGGGAGNRTITRVSLVLGTPYAIVIGAGGTGGASVTAGNPGGNTTFNATQTANGGLGGVATSGGVPKLGIGRGAPPAPNGDGYGGGAGAAFNNVDGNGTNGGNATSAGGGGGGGGGGINNAGTTGRNGGTGGNGFAGDTLVYRA